MIFSGHFCAVRIELLIAGRTALTAFGLMALVIARAAAWAAVFTDVILSLTAVRVGPRRTARYGSTLGEIVECWAIDRMVSRARSRAPASFLLDNDFLSASTAL